MNVHRSDQKGDGSRLMMDARASLSLRYGCAHLRGGLQSVPNRQAFVWIYVCATIKQLIMNVISRRTVLLLMRNDSTYLLCSNIENVSMGCFQIQCCFTICFVDMIKETSVTSHVLAAEWQSAEGGRKPQQAPRTLLFMEEVCTTTLLNRAFIRKGLVFNPRPA